METSAIPDFRLFGRSHLIALVATALLTIALPMFFAANANAQIIGRALMFIVSFSVISWTFWRYLQHDFAIQNDLPLDICNLMGLMLPLLLWRPLPVVFDILYYLIIVGTLLALITPHLEDDFPHPTYIKYWVVHGGLVITIIYVAVAHELRPTLIGIGYAFTTIIFYGIGLIMVNRRIGANYLYVLRKPSTPTLLDYFGPWPWYMLFVSLTGLCLFGVAYLPWYLIL